MRCSAASRRCSPSALDSSVRSIFAAGVALAAALPGVEAQRQAHVTAGVSPSTATPAVAMNPATATPPAWRSSRELAPLASLLVPGAGQAMLRRDRFLAYLAVETFALLQYAKDKREGSRERARYLSLSRDVARAPFGGARPVGSWDYYEEMQKYPESGEFSSSLTDTIPEADTSTFNGSRWILARRTFWVDPFRAPPRTSEEYRRAIAFYLEKAVRPDFRWTWRNAQLQLDLYRRSIERANDSARRARSAATVILANHLLSAVDAFATVRLQEASTATGRELRLHISVPVER